MNEEIKTTLQIYSLTLLIPIILTALIICALVLGLELEYSYPYLLKAFWIDFYFTGNFLNVAAWRWHLLMIIIVFVFVKLGIFD